MLNSVPEVTPVDPEATRRIVGCRLRGLRAEKGFETAVELSKEIEYKFGAWVDPKMLEAMEVGEARCEIEVWWMLSQIYNTSVRQLIRNPADADTKKSAGDRWVRGGPTATASPDRYRAVYARLSSATS